ncbi:MAG: SUMF1/EgtB/PvdO family nonheme iron enzyme [Rubrivivax sp.]
MHTDAHEHGPPAEAAAGPAGVSIFISHAASDPDWPDHEVERLASDLERAGAEVKLDIQHQRAMGRKLAEGEWRDWMHDCLDHAQRFLLLGSHTYTKRADANDVAEPAGRGVAFERTSMEHWLYNRKQRADGRLWVLHAEGVPLPRYLRAGQPIVYALAERERLVQDLCRRLAVGGEGLQQRLREMLQRECVDLYVPVASRPLLKAAAGLRLPQSIARHVHRDAAATRDVEGAAHGDVLEAVSPRTRALVEGEPGAGKTFALLRALERDLDDRVTPVWVKLNHWLDGAQAFEAFVADEVPELGAAWPSVVEGGRGRLYLDGLNELPAQHAATQLEQINRWLQAHPGVPVLASCRHGVLPAKALPVLDERFRLQAWRATQVRRFIHKYVDDAARADALFWDVAGGEAFRRAWAGRPAEAPDGWLDELVAPAPGSQHRFDWLSQTESEALAAAHRDPARAWPLACNPYLLTLLLNVWWDDDQAAGDRLPRRRVDVLGRYTDAQIAVELEKCHSDIGAAHVQRTLTELAARLQHVAERARLDGDAAALALAWADVDAAARPALDIALGARLLRREGPLVRYEHQLLHEYYVARYLRERLRSGADDLVQHLWPGGAPLWERTGWVQPFLLLAEYQQTDTVQLVTMLADVQPEIAAAIWEQARRKSPHWLTATLADELAQRLTQRMLPRVRSREFPFREAAFGRGLGAMRDVDGRPLDRRRGVWGWFDSRSRRSHVDVDWVRVEPGSFIFQGQRVEGSAAYWIARHPITCSQFQAFVDDPDGWPDPQWWDGTPVAERQAAWQPRWRYGNHPCERVSWWLATAYCRWLAALLGEPGIALPSERQWERVAAGPDGAEYPWRGVWSPAHANGDFSLDMTSPCGLFADAGSTDPAGVHDLAGNVWEWTADLLGSSADAQPPLRVARGGAWLVKPRRCRAQARHGYPPESRLSCVGFRVVRPATTG